MAAPTLKHENGLFLVLVVLPRSTCYVSAMVTAAFRLQVSRASSISRSGGSLPAWCNDFDIYLTHLSSLAITNGVAAVPCRWVYIALLDASC